MDYEEFNALSQEEQAAVLEAGGSVPAPVGAGPSSEPLSPGTSPVVSAVATARGATTTFDGWSTGDDGTHTHSSRRDDTHAIYLRCCTGRSSGSEG